MGDFKINFNNYAKVRLTDFGIGIMKQRHDELNAKIKKHGGKGLGEFELRIDDDGYSKFQIWSLMNTFGEYMHLGYEPPFNSELIFCGAEPITKEGE